MIDTIYLSGEEAKAGIIPVEPSEHDPDYIKHVYCQGSRDHVLSYHLIGGKSVETCSEPKCIMNKEIE